MKNPLTFAAIALLGLFCGCSKPATPAAPVRWEYAVFEYHDPDFGSFAGSAKLCSIEFSQGPGLWTGSNNLYSAESVLNQIGEHGWELVWSDGRKFIVKRPAGVSTNGVFLVTETLVPNPR